jgi:hypothetical protein
MFSWIKRAGKVAVEAVGVALRLLVAVLMAAGLVLLTGKAAVEAMLEERRGTDKQNPKP